MLQCSGVSRHPALDILVRYSLIRASDLITPMPTANVVSSNNPVGNILWSLPNLIRQTNAMSLTLLPLGRKDNREATLKAFSLYQNLFATPNSIADSPTCSRTHFSLLFVMAISIRDA